MTAVSEVVGTAGGAGVTGVAGTGAGADGGPGPRPDPGAAAGTPPLPVPVAALLKARPGLHFAPVPGGVYFSGTRGRFVLRGAEVLFAVAEVSVPLLEAGTTEDELVAELGTERARPAVRHLVTQLRENGLLLDPAALTVPEPPAAVRARHADSLARLASRLDDPYAAFARLRGTRVELRGSAAAVAPAERGLRRAGVERITTADTNTPGTTTTSAAAGTPADGTTAHATPAGAPAANATPPSTPAGDPAVGTTADLNPVGDPAVHPTGGLNPIGDPMAGTAAITFLTGTGTGTGTGRESGDVTWAETDGTLHIPVLLGPELTLVGPAGASRATWDAFRGRALSWARAEGVEPAPGPVSHALAGALAAQLLADVLTGVAEPGEAHVLHGRDLTADRVTVTGAPVTEAAEVADLDDLPAEEFPEPESALAAAGAVAARWTGLLASTQGENLPQMPLALRTAEQRTDDTGPGTVTAWAAHQEAATVAAALAALRDRSSGTPGTPAAGLTREHWLLDGALRQLAGTATESAPSEPALDPEGHRILAALRALPRHAEPVLGLAQVQGVDWTLARVSAGGAVVGAGWGPTPTEATYAALCTALAAAQADDRAAVAPLSTDALLTVDDATRAALRNQLVAAGLTCRGHARRTDPLLGEIPLWYGPVEVFARTAQESPEPQESDHVN